LPVETVNWFACRDTLQRFGLMLPSELQWEYGIRGGTTTAWWTGDDEKALLAAENIGGAEDAKLLPVGSKSANPFGLFDMGGNVGEWCYDEIAAYGTERAGDGRRPEPGTGPLLRCYRGGGFVIDSDGARSGNRHDIVATFRNDDLGARPARTSRR